MLLRIKRPLSGAVDGIDLTQFEQHAVYSVTTELASFLLAIDAAEPVDEYSAHPSLGQKRLVFGRQERSIAADRRRWNGKERRRVKR